MTVDLDALERDANRLLDMTVGADTTLALIAHIRQLEQSNATKTTRIAELLAAMAREPSTRYTHGDCAKQDRRIAELEQQRDERAAEVGTLKARVAELEREHVRDCTCLGSCKGAGGLAPGWRCALGRTP